MKVYRLVMLAAALLGALAITAAALAGARESFVVKTTDSVVTVFRNEDKEKPFLKTAIKDSFLPEEDRFLLSVGIEVDNETELWSILEDLGS